MKKEMTKRIVTSGLTLAMVLNMVNFPLFSVGAKAEENQFRANAVTVKSLGEGNEEPKFIIPTITAFCGDKLADLTFIQPENGKLEWINPDTVLKEGHNSVEAKFVPDDTNKYKTVDNVTVDIVAVHNFEKKKNLSFHTEEEPVEDEAGSREYYQCSICGKKIGADNQVHDDNYFIIPYIPKSVDIEMGTTSKIASYVLNGVEGVKTTSIDNADKYKAYFTFDESTGEINSPSSAKYYKKKKFGTPTITITDQAGETYKVKLNLKNKKPDTFKVDRRNKNGVYEYTLECKAANADNIKIEAISGLYNNSTQKALNKILSKKVGDNIKKSNKEASVKISFTSTKRAIKGKVKFQAVAIYGKNESLPYIKSEK